MSLRLLRTGAGLLTLTALPSSLAFSAQAPAAAADTASAPVPAGTARPWPHETSDIPLDPRIRFGHFENGLRWAWATNVEPDQRAYLRLHVDAGSLAETESELGMAHFLEHMAFNGSEHYPAGTLIEWFQTHGMAFGADTNASTGFSETVYKLDLPTSDEATLRSGLEVLRDFAAGLLLEDEEVQAEKGVIDGEQRERDSPGFRAFVKGIETVYAGTRVPERLPIGTKEARDAFTTESVRAFYTSWYRPETMTLVLVGDLGETDPVPLFEEAFGDLAPGTAPVPAEPPHGEPTWETLSFTIFEDEIPSVQLSLRMLHPYEHHPLTIEEQVSELPLVFANTMLNLRLRELAKKDATPFLSAHATSFGGQFDLIEGPALTISCRPEAWEDSLVAADWELRRALKYGFQQAEIDEVRADILRSLDESVEREPTAHSLSLVRSILSACEHQSVPTDAATDRKIVRPVVEALTIEACHQALVEEWSRGQLSLTAVGNLDLGENGADRLHTTLAEAREIEVGVGEVIEVEGFAYSSRPEAAGRIVRDEHVEDLDLRMVEFSNGARLNLKQTDFKKNQILVTARVAEGKRALPPERGHLMFAADAAVNGGGLEAHSNDDLRRLTAGKQVGVSFAAETDSFRLRGSTTADDLLFELELFAAHLRAPGWRAEGFRQLEKRVPLVFDNFETNHQGPLVLDFLPELLSNDLRFLPVPPRPKVDELTLDVLRDWIAPELADGPLEVTLVGALDPDAAIAAAARTIGALPQRRAPRAHADLLVITPPKPGLRMERTIRTEVQKALVFMAIPTTDGIDYDRGRLLDFLGVVLSDRLRIEIREKLGTSYSPGAGANSSRVYPGLGWIAVQAMADPKDVKELVAGIEQVLKTLHDEGVTQEEVARLREPLVARLRDSRRANGFWATHLQEAQGRPESLEELRTLEAFYAALDAEELSKLAAEYLAPERASLLIVRPEGAEGTKAREASTPKDG